MRININDLIFHPFVLNRFTKHFIGFRPKSYYIKHGTVKVLPHSQFRLKLNNEEFELNFDFINSKIDVYLNETVYRSFDFNTKSEFTKKRILFIHKFIESLMAKTPCIILNAFNLKAFLMANDIGGDMKLKHNGGASLSYFYDENKLTIKQASFDISINDPFSISSGDENFEIILEFCNIYKMLLLRKMGLIVNNEPIPQIITDGANSFISNSNITFESHLDMTHSCLPNSQLEFDGLKSVFLSNIGWCLYYVPSSLLLLFNDGSSCIINFEFEAVGFASHSLNLSSPQWTWFKFNQKIPLALRKKLDYLTSFVKLINPRL